MTDLATFRDALVTGLRPGFDAKVKIGTHVGAMTLEDVEAYAQEAPCLKVAVLSGKEYSNTDCIATTKVSIFIVTKTGKAGTYDKQLLLLASQLWGFAHATMLGGDDAERSQGIEFQNLTTRATGAEGVGLGAVTWLQNIKITVPEAEGLAPFLLLYQTLNFPDGETIVTDVINMPQE